MSDTTLDFLDSHIAQIAGLLSLRPDAASNTLAQWLMETAEAHQPREENPAECRAMCWNEEWPCSEWAKATGHAVSWLISDYERIAADQG